MDTIPEESFYLTPGRKIRCRFTVLGSNFIGTLAPACSEEAVQKIISATKKEFSDATHHASAFRIGAGDTMVERTSDDREPGGSAGAPMLRVLQGKNVSDAVVIGTRYFGGTKLGIGGLARAYQDCARLPVEKAELIKKEQEEFFLLGLNYEDWGSVTRLIKTLEGIIMKTTYTDSVTVKVKVPARSSENLMKSFRAVTKGRGTWSRI